MQPHDEELTVSVDLSPIDRCLDRWHRYVASPSPDGLDALLHDEIVFSSPIVFTPQHGKERTTLYLAAAAHVFAGEGRGFRYVRELRQGHDAALEFETEIDGAYVNGVDLITCDDDGLIIDFKVMVRPLQGIEAAHRAMQALLEGSV